MSSKRRTLAMMAQAITSHTPLSHTGLNVARVGRMMCSLIDFDFDCLRVPRWS